MDARLSQQPTLQFSDLQPSTLPASTLDSSNPDDIPIPGMGDNPPPPADEPSPDPEIFVTGVALNLTTDRYILGDGDEATLTVTVQRNLAESVAGMTLTLVTPPELRISGDLTWTLPELAEEEIFSRTVQVGVAQSNGQAVYEILAQVSSPGSKDAVMSLPLILRTQAADAPNRPQEVTTAVTVSGQETSGVMLTSPRGDMAVMAPAGVFEIGSEVRYTDLYRRAAKEDPVVDPAPTPTEQPQTDRGNQLYLPWLTGHEVENRGAALGAAPVSDAAARSLRPEFGSNQQVHFYRVWQLDVTAPTNLTNAQTEDKTPTRFEEPVTLLIQVGELLDLGIDLASLALWTREGEQEDEPWQMVYTLYDAPSRTLIAQVHHFSQWGLGNGLTSSGNVLPSVKTFSSDRFTGNASVSYPIDVPTGLGGMAPALSLSYSSSSADDLALYPNNTYAYKSQAGWAGLGWNLGGLSFISRDPEKSLGSTYDVYQMVLNGTSVEIWYNEANGAYDTNPASFMKIERYYPIPPYNLSDWDERQDSWIVTTGDGTKYTFGGPNGNMQSFESYYNGGWKSRRAVNRWYLREVRDRLDNYMTFGYAKEPRTLGGNCLNGYFAGTPWYDRSYYPTEIYWSGNSTAGVPQRMRVRFETESREDWNIDGANNSCDAGLYTNNRLKRIWVEVNDVQVGGWHTLRKVELGHDYSAPVNNGRWPQAQHSQLKTITQFGKGGNGTPLNTQTFTYGGVHNDIRLHIADNGQGGVVRYEYVTEQPSVCNWAWCNTYNHSYRHPVAQMGVLDGMGSVITTTYAYNTPRASVQDIDSLGFLGYEYLGHAYAKATLYEKVDVGQPVGQIVQEDEQWFYQDVANTGTQGRVVDPRRGRAFQHRTWNVAGYTLYTWDFTFWTALKKTGSDWTATTSFNTTDIYWVRQDGKKVWGDNGSNAQYLYYDTADQGGGQYGNVTRTEERSYGGDLGNYAVKGLLLRTTRTQYYPNAALHIVNKPARVTVKDANGLCMADTHFVYDGQSWYGTAPIWGLQSRVEQIGSRESNGGCKEGLWTVDQNALDMVVSQTTYDNVGNVVSQDILDGVSDAVITVYDSQYRLFPVERYSQASGALKEQARYYGVGTGNTLSSSGAFWGQMQGFCMADGSTTYGCTTQSYDAFGRPVRRWELQPNFNLGSDASAATAYFYVPRGGVNTANTYIEWHAPRCMGGFTRQLYNGLGQLVQSQGPAEDWTVSVDGCNLGNAGSEVVVDYEYNALGQQSRQSVPHTVNQYAGGNLLLAANWSLGQTSTTYDGMGRPVRVVAPNQVKTTYCYGGRATAVLQHLGNTDPAQYCTAPRPADEQRIVSWTQNDDLGRMVRTVNFVPSGTWWGYDSQVQLSYDGADNLIKTERRDGSSGPWVQLSSLTYDLLGRKTAMSDADLGNWSYAYDKRNNLITQTDALTQTTSLTYNDMGQLTARSVYSGSLKSSYSYAYDAKARPTVVTQTTGGNWQRQIGYDSLGRPSTETVTIDSTPKTTVTGYDNYNRPNQVTYPDGEVLTTSFNSMGLPRALHSTVSGYLVGANSATAGENAKYDAAGRPVTMTFPAGSGLIRTQTYYPWTDAQNGGILKEIRVAKSGSPDPLYRQYTYNSFGDVATLKETSNSTPFTFGYDSLDRLTSAYGETFSYDQAGRRTDGGRGYDTAQPYHALKSKMFGPNGYTYAYDANGNMKEIRDTGSNLIASFTWNAENRLSTVTKNNVTESYAYDADGNRIKEVSSNITTYDFFPMYQEERATNPVETVWVEDALPAGAVPASSGGDSWNWVTSPKTSGSKAHASANAASIHQHYFTNATQTLVVGANDMLFTWVYLDPASQPRQVMLQWYDGSWEHRAYWGENLITWGTDGTDSRRSMGPLPTTGGWVRLEVPAATVGLAGRTVTGMAFSLYDGKATWDRTGKVASTITKQYAFNGQIIATSRGGALSYLHTDHLSSNSVSTNASGGETARRTYYAYGSQRTSTGTLPTDRTYTGQEQDTTGLMFYHARFYDPALGTFISPDTIVPGAGNVQSYNRYLYVSGNPLKYLDPNGHIGICFQGSPQSSADEDGPIMQMCDQLAKEGLIDGKIVKLSNGARARKIALDSILDALEANADEQIVIVGFSWGGSAALQLAEALSDRNVTVDSMILVELEDFVRPSTPSEVPANVNRTLNIFMSSKENKDERWPFGSPQNGIDKIEGALSVGIAEFTAVNEDGDRKTLGTTHRNIVNANAHGQLYKDGRPVMNERTYAEMFYFQGGLWNY